MKLLINYLLLFFFWAILMDIISFGVRTTLMIKGRIIENFINKNNLCLYNNKTPTYLHPATGTYTSLDLSICYPTLLLDYEWKVHDDPCGSDHFPIFLNNIAPQLEEPITRWKLTKADWPSFKALCETEINDTILQADDPIDRFTTTLHQLAVFPVVSLPGDYRVTDEALLAETT